MRAYAQPSTSGQAQRAQCTMPTSDHAQDSPVPSASSLPTANSSAFTASSHDITHRSTFDIHTINLDSSSLSQSDAAAAHCTSNRMSVLSRKVRRLSTRMSALFIPEKRTSGVSSLRRSMRSIILMSWLNVLLVFIPTSWVFNFVFPHTDKNDTLIFIFSFLGIIPLARLLALATDELSMRVGQTLAGLLNATLGNAVELIVSIIALVHCELQIVQSSLVGSILSNLLFVLGMCFFAGGIKFSEQGFGVNAAQLNSSLLTVSVIAVILPAAFHQVVSGTIPDDSEALKILSFSRGAAIILLLIYGSFLIFQLFSHKTLYDDDSSDILKSTNYPPRPPHDFETHHWLILLLTRSANNSAKPPVPPAGTPKDSTVQYEMSTRSINASEVGSLDLAGDSEAQLDVNEDEGEEKPQLSVWLTIVLLVTVTALVAVTAEWLVNSIDGLTNSGTISKEFVGLILLPIASNASDHVTAVTVSVKDKLTLSLGVAVGSSIQIALFIIPSTVMLSWMMGKPLTLLFDPFETVALFLAVLLVNYIVQDGKSNWLEGMILMCLYMIIAVTFWYYPGTSITQQVASKTLLCST